VRYPADHKAETHDRIVKKAAEEFRRNGLEGIGIANLMGTLGLTHGGFYAHFSTKDDLVLQASVSILEDNLARMLAAAEAAPPERSVQAILDYYLSPEHRDNPAFGCVLPSIASELSRRPECVREGFTKAMKAALERLAAFMPAKTKQARMDQSIALFSAMAGAVLLARAISDPELSDRVLRSSRLSLAAAFRR
jgi:TetR/AcrR family transcriptional repressor of nem operon